MPPDIDDPRLPVTIVTGFLGSGKTTLVNHILAHQTGLRIAVMVNEIGDIAIDGDLIAGAAADTVELANGCICCSLNNDLVDATFRVLRRDPPIDCLLVETSGLADPLPIALTFSRSEFRAAVRIDSIVALADAENFSLDRFAAEAALNQLRYADFVLLNKCDLATRETVERVEARIRSRTASARILRVTHAAAALPLILGSGRFGGHAQPSGRGHDHIAQDGFEAVSFATDRTVSADRFQAFLEALPVNVFRAKGILAIDGSRRRHLFHLVGRRFTLAEAPPAVAGDSRLVLIGQNLDAARLQGQLGACLVPFVTPAAE